jgi:hypothetical protein
MLTTVKRILHKHGYSPDMQEKATTTVLEQAELIARDWCGRERTYREMFSLVRIPNMYLQSIQIVFD